MSPELAEYRDFLPSFEMMPSLTDAEVERFVELGEMGAELFRLGDLDAAAAAFRRQLAIFNANHEPYVWLALVEASRGRQDAAIDHLRSATVRGFTDLRRIERAEAWVGIDKTILYRKLEDAMRAFASVERSWSSWSTFGPAVAPASLAAALREEADCLDRIERIAPALGPRLTRLWNTLIPRVTASRLQSYVKRKQKADDFVPALEHLMTLYAGGPLQRWGRLKADAAERLDEVARLALDKLPADGPTRPAALVGAALAAYAERTPRGVLKPPAAEIVRGHLNEVLSRHGDSAVAATAAVGLIRTELKMSDRARAAEIFARFRSDHAGDPAALAGFRRGLGSTALWLGGLPEFTATALDGSRVGTQTLQGKVAVVDFWATWCGPCTEEIPTLRRIADRFGDDVVMVGVNLDSVDDIDPQALRTWIAGRGLPGSQLHDGLSWDSQMVEEFGVEEIPFNVVVGPDGAVLAVNAHGKELEKAVKSAVRASGS